MLNCMLALLIFLQYTISDVFRSFSKTLCHCFDLVLYSFSKTKLVSKVFLVIIHEGPYLRSSDSARVGQ